jgi:hypothetical protein
VGFDEYNEAAIRALERAQKARGVRSAEAFVKLLAARTGGYPSSSTYHRWLRGETPIPAWVVLVAAEEAQQSLDGLLADVILPRPVHDRLDAVNASIGDLQTQIADLHERMDRLSPLDEHRAPTPAS